ncbi:MAG: hypothetical protein JWQ04_928 [Pedosphaera sp.]|nr:hypothetical protein [Pedosphaera sp.]
MSKKHILVADAEPGAAEVFSQALGEQWEVVPALSGTGALKMLHDQTCQVVVASIDLPELDGAELLNRTRSKHPKAVRFMAARDEDKQRAIKTARGAHQFLGKPYVAATIKDAVERALALDVWVSGERIRETISRIRTLPTIPTLYVEVVAALRSPEATTEQVGAIIAKDMAMMTKILQLLNSACFGLTREITDPAEAVGILGFETVKTMVMTIKLLNQYDKLKASDFSIDRLWQHSTAVARTARQLALLETRDRALADAAFTAGLLHDLGKVVMAANFEVAYSGALLVGFKQQLTAWTVEKDVFGANHGEIGAYLLGLWGMPLNLLEATALHHEPSRCTNKGFSPLTAVHVANVLEREISPDELGMISPKLDEAYLDGLGLLNRVQAWRDAILNRDSVKVEPKAEVVEVLKLEPAARPKPVPAPTLSVKPAPIPAQQPLPEPEFAMEPAGSASRNKWLFVGAGACVLSLFAWFTIETTTSQPQTSQTEQALPIPAKHAQVKPVDRVADKPVAAGFSNSEVSLFSPTIVRAREVTNQPVAAASPKPASLSDFKLQGIFFSKGNPSAIINGKTVRPNDRVGEAQITSITASNLTLSFHNESHTLSIK